MARFRCVCGEQIVTSGEIPNELEWRVLSDLEFDEFSGLVDVDVIYRRSKMMFRCPKSGHLWFFWNGFENDPELYSPQPLVKRQGKWREDATY